MAKKTAQLLHRCNRAGCAEIASWQVALRIWALGQQPRTPHNCCNALMNPMVCDGCRDQVKPADLLTIPVKEKIANQLIREYGAVVPDFTSAEVYFLPVDGEPIAPLEFERGQVNGQSS